jgi:hypothetical protein
MDREESLRSLLKKSSASKGGKQHNFYDFVDSDDAKSIKSIKSTASNATQKTSEVTKSILKYPNSNHKTNNYAKPEINLNTSKVIFG